MDKAPDPWDIGPVPTAVDVSPEVGSKGLPCVRLTIQTPTGSHVVFLTPKTSRTVASHLINASKEAEVASDKKAGNRTPPDLVEAVK